MKPILVLKILKAHYDKYVNNTHVFKVPCLEAAEIKDCIREIERVQKRGKLSTAGGFYYARAVNIADRIIKRRYFDQSSSSTSSSSKSCI